jgi:hypothetical protein
MFRYIAFGLHIESEVELPELSIDCSQQSIDLQIQVKKITLPKLKNTSIYRRGVRAKSGGNYQNDLYIYWEGIAAFQALDGKVLYIDPQSDEANLISLFTVSEALGLILFQRGLFLLHASAVQVGDEAWCFMGRPGAGKSTTAAAFVKAGCKLLSDDLTAIDFDSNGQAMVIPAYPQLKIWDNTVAGLSYERDELVPVSEGVNKFSYQPKANFSHQAMPLKQIYFMHHAKNKPKLKAVSAVEIPIQMLKNFPLGFGLLQGENLKTHFIQSFKCAQHVKIWSKRRPEGFDKLEEWVKESIYLTTLELHV